MKITITIMICIAKVMAINPKGEMIVYQIPWLSVQ